MKVITEELRNKIIHNRNCIGSQLKWSDIYDTEEELIRDMCRVSVHAKSKNILSRYVRGYEYITGFTKYYLNNRMLSQKQLGVLKRHMFKEITYYLYSGDYVKGFTEFRDQYVTLDMKQIPYKGAIQDEFRNLVSAIEELRNDIYFSFISFIVYDNTDGIVLCLDTVEFSPESGYSYETFYFILDRDTLKINTEKSDVVYFDKEKLETYVHKSILLANLLVGPVDCICINTESRGDRYFIGYNDKKEDFLTIDTSVKDCWSLLYVG